MIDSNGLQRRPGHYWSQSLDHSDGDAVASRQCDGNKQKSPSADIASPDGLKSLICKTSERFSSGNKLFAFDWYNCTSRMSWGRVTDVTTTVSKTYKVL